MTVASEPIERPGRRAAFEHGLRMVGMLVLEQSAERGDRSAGAAGAVASSEVHDEIREASTAASTSRAARVSPCTNGRSG